MTRTSTIALISLLAVTAPAMAGVMPQLPTAPAEVVAAAPAATHLIAFASSGNQPDADAAAVFEGAPDKDGVQHRTLIVFGKKGGKFEPDFTNDKLIGCSKCTQFHDDPFWPENLKVTPSHILLDQFDSGEKPSTTTINLERKATGWVVTSAERQTVVAGDGAVSKAKLSLPKSGLAKDMDGQWTVPVVLNTLMVNNKNGKFMLVHRGTSPEQVWESHKASCNKQDCTILVQQQDGCISLAKDAAGRFFGAGTPNPKDKSASIGKAKDACTAAGGNQCEVIRTDCNRGM